MTARIVELDDVIRFRIRADEKKSIEAEASGQGLTTSAFIRGLFRLWMRRGITQEGDDHVLSVTVPETRESTVPGDRIS